MGRNWSLITRSHTGFGYDNCCHQDLVAVGPSTQSVASGSEARPILAPARSNQYGECIYFVPHKHRVPLGKPTEYFLRILICVSSA